MTTRADDSRIAEYCRKLRWALSTLPDVDRDGIVAETQSHVLDRVDAGASLDEVLGALGDPDDYARAFREAHSIATALSSRRTPHMLRALLEGAARSLAAAGAGLAILVIWVLAALVAYVAVLKVSDPAHVGLWSGQHFFFLGIIDDPSTGRELLGPWITPLALVCIVIAWFATRYLAVWALKRLTTPR